MSRLTIDTIRTKAMASVTGSYTTLGTALTHTWRAFCITNNTNGDMFFSIDGTNDQIFIPAFSFRLYDIATNMPPAKTNDNFLVGIATQWYVRYSTAPTLPATGAVYVEGILARGE